MRLTYAVAMKCPRAALVPVILLLASGCHRKKKTVTIEPYSLIEGAEPSSPLAVRADVDQKAVTWKPGTPCVLPLPAGMR